jgi:hypothetical protein
LPGRRLQVHSDRQLEQISGPCTYPRPDGGTQRGQRDYHPNPFVTCYPTRDRFLVLAKHRASTNVWALDWAETMRTQAEVALKARAPEGYVARNGRFLAPALGVDALVEGATVAL